MNLSLIIEEAARWKKEVAANNLSPESIKKIKDNGISKSKSDYAGGLRKGSENIINKAGYKLDTDKMSFLKNARDSIKGVFTGGHYTNTNSKTVRSPDELGFINKKLSPFKNPDPIERELILRHEANEAKYAPPRANPLPRAKIGVDDKLVGNHNSMKVIADEAKDANFYKNLYGSNTLNDVRQNRENLALKKFFGVGYNDINFNNIKPLKSKITNYEKNTIEPEIERNFKNYLSKSNDYYEKSTGFFDRLKKKKEMDQALKRLQFSPYQGYSVNQS